MKKYLLITAGSLSLAFGVAGIFLPVLPTTPFLLLSAACYLRSSVKLYNWLINHKVLGIYIKNYIQHRAITIKTKIISVSFMWAVMLCSIIFFVPILWVKILIGIIGICVSIHLITMKTLTPEMIKQYNLNLQSQERDKRVS